LYFTVVKIYYWL